LFATWTSPFFPASGVKGLTPKHVLFPKYLMNENCVSQIFNEVCIVSQIFIQNLSFIYLLFIFSIKEYVKRKISETTFSTSFRPRSPKQNNERK
jgi:hypothetical protein